MRHRTSVALGVLLTGLLAAIIGCSQGDALQGATIQEASPDSLPSPTATPMDAEVDPATPTPAPADEVESTAPLLPSATPTATGASLTTPTSTPTLDTPPNAAAITEVTPTAVLPKPTATPEPSPIPVPVLSEATAESLFLQITEPGKEEVVRVSSISISGITTSDALVSVNGDLVDVNKDGEFTTEVELQEAPNLIEVVASDFQGNAVSTVLTIIFIP